LFIQFLIEDQSGEKLVDAVMNNGQGLSYRANQKLYKQSAQQLRQMIKMTMQPGQFTNIPYPPIVQP